MDTVFFIDYYGQRFSAEGVRFHVDLANIVMEKKPELKDEFVKSGKLNPIEFFMEDKGCIAGNEGPKGNSITYDSELLSEVQRKLVQYYLKKGYNFYDLAEERRRLQKESFR